MNVGLGWTVAGSKVPPGEFPGDGEVDWEEAAVAVEIGVAVDPRLAVAVVCPEETELAADELPEALLVEVTQIVDPTRIVLVLPSTTVGCATVVVTRLEEGGEIVETERLYEVDQTVVAKVNVLVSVPTTLVVDQV